MKRRFWVVLSIGLMGAALWPRMATAAPMGIYLSHAASVPLNGTVDVQVRTNSTFEPNVVQANMSYDQSKLQYQSISTVGTHYEMGVEESGGNGTVRIARATFNASAGDHLVATVTFKALVGGGATQLSFDGGSVMTDSTTSDTTTHPSILSFVGSAQSTPVPTRMPNPKPTATATPTPVPAAAADTTPPEITGLNITGVTMLSATISWHTDEPTTGSVAYGNDETYGNAIVSAEVKTDHKITIESDKLQPLTLYNFKITAKDAAGNEASLPNQTFTTTGAPVVARIVDHTNQPLKSAVVTVAGTTQTTGAAGEARFALGLGPHDFSVKYGDVARVERFTVMAPASANAEQTFVMTLKIPAKSPTVSIALGLGSIAGLATAVFFLIKYTHRPRPGFTFPSPYDPKPPVY